MDAMAWQTLESGLRFEAPRLSVALLQSETAMLHSPAHDVSSFLRAQPRRWRVETFTERMFDGVEKIAASFDCVVIGFNAVCHDGEIRKALLAADDVPPNLLVLHQHGVDSLAFLRDETRSRSATSTGAPARCWRASAASARRSS